MNISALIFDLDGTAIPNNPDGMPSKRLIDAVQKAKEKTKVSSATGREIIIAQPVIGALGLTSPSIVAGGAQIVDSLSFAPLWERVLTAEKIKEIVSVCSDIPYAMGAYSDNGKEKSANTYDNFFDKPILYIINVPTIEATSIAKQLSSVSEIAIHVVKGWKEGHSDIHMTHKDASKKHALEEWLRIENIDRSEVMVVGDSGNDLPLFEVGALKIAMGNGSDELKSQADWVAPSVDDDGLAVAIEKYILSSEYI